ncbi:acetyltransferase [Magnaporthiopsis poae ATCC 64411]|uniref:Acetyltransferase n=1 Tax=Magnaporthiopsis poae (strain ATCC 64411 / 73-15) TaxID=644358 RepID=A0A0C4DLB2_MAGP6|nr:acetyltransferase [Magnaporthiopsis poae ATCC 64411]
MSHHMVAITELDLSNCRPNSIADRINDVPGLKTSTAFFTFLRANLVQPSSAMSSRVNTPLLEPQTTTSQRTHAAEPSSNSAVRVTRERCGRDAEVGFAKEHANSVMVLPEMFNGPFRKGERKAAMALEAILVEFESTRRKK